MFGYLKFLRSYKKNINVVNKFVGGSFNRKECVREKFDKIHNLMEGEIERKTSVKGHIR